MKVERHLGGGHPEYVHEVNATGILNVALAAKAARLTGFTARTALTAGPAEEVAWFSPRPELWPVGAGDPRTGPVEP